MSDLGELSNEPIGAEEKASAPAPEREPQPRDEHGHFASKDPGKGKGKRKSKRGSDGELSIDELRTMLADTMSATAPFVALPTAQIIWSERSAEAVENLVVLARRYPSLRRSLESGTLVFAGIGLLNFTSAVAYGAAADLGFADPTSIAAQTMGITDAYYTAHPEAEEEELDHGGAGEGPRAPDREPASSRSNGSRRLTIPGILGDVHDGASELMGDQ